MQNVLTKTTCKHLALMQNILTRTTCKRLAQAPSENQLRNSSCHIVLYIKLLYIFSLYIKTLYIVCQGQKIKSVQGGIKTPLHTYRPLRDDASQNAFFAFCPSFSWLSKTDSAGEIPSYHLSDISYIIKNQQNKSADYLTRKNKSQ